MIDITKAANIKGWMSISELEWLAKAARNKLAIVEFGCYHGRSTRALADHMNGLILAVDPWNGQYYDNNGDLINIIEPAAYDGFKQNLKDHIDSGRVQMMKCHSWEFPALPFTVDMVFIDGDHRYEEVKKDIKIAKRLLRPGGLIAGHDYTHTDWPGVKQAVDESFRNCQFHDSIWWTQK